MANAAAQKLDLSAPGPGFWEQDPVHFPRPLTRYFQETHPPAFKQGTGEFARFYGMLIDGLQIAYVGGFAYNHLMPAPEAEIPGRLERAANVFGPKLWREQLREWDEVAKPVAIAISLGSIAFGWIVYDLICKSPFGNDNTRLMVALYFILVAVAWGYTQLFTGRAAFLHLGAFTATIMSANVFFIIIPNQKIVVADLIAGRTPDPKYGKIAKQRSTHNNYLTLPVLFLMLSNHYPLALATAFNWIIAALVFLMGVTIRHWFNTTHARRGRPTWTWLATALLFILIMWLSSAPRILTDQTATAATAPVFQQFVANAHFPAARDVVVSRCSMCHTAEPAWEGLQAAPKGVILDNDTAIASLAREIYLQAGRSHAMPPGNVTDATPEERRVLTAWYESTVSGEKIK